MPDKSRIDVTVATLNNARTIKHCLQAIHDYVPLGTIVVVDGGSVDGTLEIANEFNVRIVHEKGLLGQVRYRQAQASETEWIAYVDSDIYLYPNWWSEVSRHIDDPEVGMVLGFCDLELRGLPEYDSFLKYRARKFGTEAFSNTLIKRQLVLECKNPLKKVHAGEDSVVARHIKESGLRIVTIPKLLCFHDKNIIESHPRAYYRSGKSIRLSDGAIGVYRMTNSLMAIIRDWFAFSKDNQTYSLALLTYLCKLWLCMVLGYLSTLDLANRTSIRGK